MKSHAWAKYEGIQISSSTFDLDQKGGMRETVRACLSPAEH